MKIQTSQLFLFSVFLPSSQTADSTQVTGNDDIYDVRGETGVTGNDRKQRM